MVPWLRAHVAIVTGVQPLVAWPVLDPDGAYMRQGFGARWLVAWGHGDETNRSLLDGVSTIPPSKSLIKCPWRLNVDRRQRPDRERSPAEAVY